MGRYCGQGDVIPSLVSTAVAAQITNDDPDATTVEETVFATHVEDAEAEVDTYLGQRFSLPLSTVPVVVRRLAARVTRYRLYVMRPGGPEDWIRADYEQALATLSLIRDGKLSLGTDASGQPVTAAASSTAGVRVTTVEPTFGRDKLGSY